MGIEHLGKGCIPVPANLKANHFVLGAIPPQIDWSQPYLVETGFTLSQRYQDGSSSCTAQATSYYSEALEQIDNKKSETYSARYIYSQTHQRDGGAFISDAMSIPVKVGIASLDSVPEGDSSELIMVDTSLNNNAIIEARAFKYALIPNPRNIDSLASIVKQYGGFVTGFSGNNDMFQLDGTANIPISQDWGHAVWVCGYELRQGVKFLRFKNSWGNWGTNGYGFFPEQFVKNGPMFDAYVYASLQDLNNPMTEQEVKNLYALAFYRLPTVDELNFWKGKQLGDFLKQAITDRAKFLTANE